jgi:hypothetical protein
LPPAPPREKHVGDVRTNDEKKESHGTHEKLQGTSRIPDDPLLQWRDPIAHLAVRLRIIRFETRGDRSELGFRSHQGRALCEATDDSHPVRPAKTYLLAQCGVPPDGNPHVRTREGKGKTLRHHAENPMGHIVELDRSPDEGWIRGESITPETIGQHHGRLRTRPGVGGIEDAPFERGHAEHREKVTRHLDGHDDGGLALDEQHTLIEPIVVGGHVVETFRSLPPVEVVGRRHLGPVPSALGVFFPEGDETGRVAEREGSQHHSVVQREDRNRRGDSQCERTHGEKWERGTAYHTAKSETKLTHENLHRVCPPSPTLPRDTLRAGAIRESCPAPRPDDADDLASGEDRGHERARRTTGFASPFQDGLRDLVAVALAETRRMSPKRKPNDSLERSHLTYLRVVFKRLSSWRAPTSFFPLATPRSVARRRVSAVATLRPRAVRR